MTLWHAPVYAFLLLVSGWARRLHRPASLDELRHLLAAAGRIRVLGSRHSFSDIADTDELVRTAMRSADAKEGVRARMDRRDADFTGK